MPPTWNLTRPIVNSDFTSSSTSNSSSCSNSDLFRSVQAALKRHRPLATLDKMGKKSKPMVLNALAKLLADMRQATHLLPDGATVKPSPNAAILMAPAADQDGCPKFPDADAPGPTFLQGALGFTGF